MWIPPRVEDTLGISLPAALPRSCCLRSKSRLQGAMLTSSRLAISGLPPSPSPSEGCGRGFLGNSFQAKSEGRCFG